MVSARAGRYRTDAESTGVTFPGLIHNFSTASTPAGLAALGPYRQPSGFTSDILVTDAQAKDEYKRDYIGIDATYFFNAAGEHQLKGGYQTEKIYNDVQRGYNADRILYYAGRTYLTSTGQSVRSGTYGYFRLLNISTLGAVESRNEALFVQDTWRVTPRLTLNLGLRFEHEKIPNFGSEGVETPIEFGWGEKLAPRLGFTFDVMGDAEVEALRLVRQVLRRHEVRDAPRLVRRRQVGGLLLHLGQPGLLGQRVGLRHRHQHHRRAAELRGRHPDRAPRPAVQLGDGPRRDGGPRAQADGVGRSGRWASATSSAGATSPAPGSSTSTWCGRSRTWASWCRASARSTTSPTRARASRSTLNDPSLPSFPKAKRDYTGLELTFQRRFSNNWGLFASYTYSKLYGNYSGLASSDEDGRTSPNVNRYFDHLENSFDRNGDLRVRAVSAPTGRTSSRGSSCTGSAGT